MCRTSVSICLIACWSMKVISPPRRRATWLGALLLTASLPAASLAAVTAVGADSQPARPGPGPKAGSGAGAGPGRQLVFRRRGSKRAGVQGDH
jgi:hypothetical protein